MKSAAELASELCEHLIPGRTGDASITDILSRTGQVTFMAHYLNSPGADQVMSAGDYRWLSVRGEEISNLRTAAELLALCRRHVVSGTQANEIASDELP
jgi:hypothetical protein